MKIILYSALLCFVSFIINGEQLLGQNVLKGKVLDRTTNKAVSIATVTLGTEIFVTTINGEYSFNNFPEGKVSITVSANNYETETVSIKASKTGSYTKNIYLKEVDASVAGFTEVSHAELDAWDDGGGINQDISSLLTSSQDIFDRQAGYNLGFSYFKPRGYNSESKVYINGAPMNDIENGRVGWYEWGGLNDVARNREFVGGLQANDFSFGSLGGEQNMNMRASAMPKQHKFTYSLSNATYWHRLMYTFGSGLTPKGWAFSASVSRRWGNGGYVDGTVYDGFGFFAAVEKKFKKHSINFTGFVSPTTRGQQGGSYQEVYDMLGTNFYNPNWGYQDGEVRNARMRSYVLPTFFLTWDYNPTEKTKLITTVSYQFGNYGTTALNWYDAPDPRPDYYRYLPSYQESPEIADLVENLWQTDISKSQINWDGLYQANYTQKQLGKQGKYMLEERRNDVSDFTLNSILNQEISDNLSLDAGLRIRNNITYNYKLVHDLLGGNNWIDIDQFAERDFASDAIEIQNDLNNPNREIGEGDVFGYSYNMHNVFEEVFLTTNFNYTHLDFYLGADLSATQFWRYGNMRNGRAPDNSYGQGDIHNFINYALKGGLTYKISGRHYLFANVLWKTRAPYTRNAYISPRIKDNVADLVSEKIFSADLNYVIQTPVVQARISVFHTRFMDGIESTAFYHDEYRTFVNYTKTGVDKTHTGVELGVNVKIISSLSASFVGTYGHHIYTSRPMATVSAENGSFKDYKYEVYQKNFYVSGTPQLATSLGLNYQAPFGIYLNANLNYVDKIYLSFNPERRTNLAVEGLNPSTDEILIDEILNQEQLHGGLTLDLSIGKSFRFKGRYTLNINVSVQNVTNNTNISTGGYEQNRFDFREFDVDKYPPKYFYAKGTTFFINTSFRF